MTPIEIRFFNKVIIPEDSVKSCWLWVGATNCAGYGLIGRGRRCDGIVCAHRLSYEIHCGEIPPGYVVDHICQNKSCVNPSHLRLAIPSENNRYRNKLMNNSSGFKGVCWSKAAKKWMVTYSVNSRTKYLGLFDKPEDAYDAYIETVTMISGVFGVEPPLLAERASQRVSPENRNHNRLESGRDCED